MPCHPRGSIRRGGLLVCGHEVSQPLRHIECDTASPQALDNIGIIYCAAPERRLAHPMFIYEARYFGEQAFLHGVGS